MNIKKDDIKRTNFIFISDANLALKKKGKKI